MKNRNANRLKTVFLSAVLFTAGHFLVTYLDPERAAEEPQQSPMTPQQQLEAYERSDEHLTYVIRRSFLDKASEQYETISADIERAGFTAEEEQQIWDTLESAAFGEKDSPCGSLPQKLQLVCANAQVNNIVGENFTSLFFERPAYN